MPVRQTVTSGRIFKPLLQVIIYPLRNLRSSQYALQNDVFENAAILLCLLDYLSKSSILKRR